jgi:zinc transporter 5/7
VVLILLTQYRDKFEKKHESSQLHFGRVLLTPIVFVVFALQMMVDQSLSSFFLATLYQFGYLLFYNDEFKTLAQSPTQP